MTASQRVDASSDRPELKDVPAQNVPTNALWEMVLLRRAPPRPEQPECVRPRAQVIDPRLRADVFKAACVRAPMVCPRSACRPQQNSRRARAERQRPAARPSLWARDPAARSCRAGARCRCRPGAVGRCGDMSTSAAAANTPHKQCRLRCARNGRFCSCDVEVC